MAKILLVEDNEMNRDLISRRLKRRGFELAVACDGAEGVEKAGEESPDLIIMDMGLPVLDGYEATRLLKGNDETRRIPVLGLSAHAMSGDANRALEAGCDEYDTKPIEWPRLLKKVEQLLSEAAQRRASTPSDEASESAEAEVEERADHVLVATSSAMFRDLVTRRLGEVGFTSRAVADADEAIQALADEGFAAALVDVALSDGGGRRVLEAHGGRREQLPVLMLASADGVSDAVDCLAAGAEDFVPQPFDRRVLGARLRAALERSRLRRGDVGDDGEATAGGGSPEADFLLHSLFPDALVGELRESGKIVPRHCPGTALLSVEVIGFHRRCDGGDPVVTLSLLQELAVTFERLCRRHGLVPTPAEPQSLLGAAGLFGSDGDPALAATACALELRDAAREQALQVRIAVHVGEVVAGVVGRRHPRFGLWGSALATLVRVRRAGVTDDVHVSTEVWLRTASKCVGEPVATIPGPSGQAPVYLVQRLLA